jgi:hypothetical protein
MRRSAEYLLQYDEHPQTFAGSSRFFKLANQSEDVRTLNAKLFCNCASTASLSPQPRHTIAVHRADRTSGRLRNPATECDAEHAHERQHRQNSDESTPGECDRATGNANAAAQKRARVDHA